MNVPRAFAKLWNAVEQIQESNFITFTSDRYQKPVPIGGKIFSTRRRAAISIDRDLVAPLDFYYRLIAPTNRE